MLIYFYYIGAIILPVLAIIFIRLIIQKFPFIHKQILNTKKLIWNNLTNIDKIKLLIFSLFIILFMEILFRMCFEFLIGYMQIRDILIK